MAASTRKRQMPLSPLPFGMPSHWGRTVPQPLSHLHFLSRSELPLRLTRRPQIQPFTARPSHRALTHQGGLPSSQLPPPSRGQQLLGSGREHGHRREFVRSL